MEIHESHISPVGWYIVTTVERFQKVNEDFNNPNRMCTAWENSYLVKANNILQAYDKVLKNEETTKDNELSDLSGKKGKWVFEGITDIVPVYEELEDLSELLWTDHERVAVKTVKSWVYNKRDLEILLSQPPKRFKK